MSAETSERRRQINAFHKRNLSILRNAYKPSPERAHVEGLLKAHTRAMRTWVGDGKFDLKTVAMSVAGAGKLIEIIKNAKAGAPLSAFEHGSKGTLAERPGLVPKARFKAPKTVSASGKSVTRVNKATGAKYSDGA